MGFLNVKDCLLKVIKSGEFSEDTDLNIALIENQKNEFSYVHFRNGGKVNIKN